METKKKMGLFSCICMGIGAIIGVGIFGSIPTSVQLAGKGTVLWVMVGACIVVLFRSLPALLTASALPANAANYMHATRLLNPWVGFMQCINGIFNVLTVVLLAVVFTPYFTQLVPMNSILCRVLFLLVMGILGLFGTKSNSIVQNVMVVLLLVAIGIYVFAGIPAVNASYLTLGEVLGPAMTVNGFVAAVGVMQSATYGAHNMVNFAEDIENPGRNVPLAVLISPMIVTFIYVLMALVTVGTVPSALDMTLAQVARNFLSPQMVTFFIVAGPIFGILTSTIPVMIANTNVLAICARDKIFPQVLTKKNKFGVYHISMVALMAVSIIIVSTGISISTAFSAFSFFSLACGIVQFIPPMIIDKRYPNCARSAVFKISKPTTITLCSLGILLSVYLCVNTAIALRPIVWMLFFAITIISYAYFFIRVKIFKNKGIDILAGLSAPYEPWEEREKMLAAQAK